MAAKRGRSRPAKSASAAAARKPAKRQASTVDVAKRKKAARGTTQRKSTKAKARAAPASSAASARRVRTPPPSPTNTEESGGQLLRVIGQFAGGDKARQGGFARLRQRRTETGSAAEKSRSGSRQRTPPPTIGPSAPEQPDLHSALSAKMAEKLEQLRYLQDFFHNPVPFDLRDKPLPTSSEPEELAKRIGEVEYQMHVLKALIEVLGEELKQLNRAALPQPRGRRRREAAQA